MVDTSLSAGSGASERLGAFEGVCSGVGVCLGSWSDIVIVRLIVLGLVDAGSPHRNLVAQCRAAEEV